MTSSPYKEVQHPYFWVWGVLLAISGFPLWLIFFQGQPLWPTVLPAGIGLFIVLFFLPLTVSIQGQKLHIVFGFIPLFVWNFPLEKIENAEAVTYTPLKTYLGWGMRRGMDGSRAFTIRGNRGVMLHMQGGKRILVGSTKAEALATAIQNASQDI